MVPCKITVQHFNCNTNNRDILYFGDLTDVPDDIMDYKVLCIAPYNWTMVIDVNIYQHKGVRYRTLQQLFYEREEMYYGIRNCKN